MLYIGSSIGNFEPGGCSDLLRRVRAGSEAGRRVAARRGPGEGRADSAGRVRRCRRGHRGLQWQHAGAAQSRARRGLRSRRLCARGRVECRRIADRDASGEPHGADGAAACARYAGEICRGRDASTPRTATSTGRARPRRALQRRVSQPASAMDRSSAAGLRSVWAGRSN